MVNVNGDKTLRIIHWNLGPSYWDKKTEELQLMVDKLNPGLAFISEANLFEGLTPHMRNIQGYNLISTASMETMGYFHLVLLVREDLQVQFLNHLMDNIFSSQHLAEDFEKGLQTDFRQTDGIVSYSSGSWRAVTITVSYWVTQTWIYLNGTIRTMSTNAWSNK